MEKNLIEKELYVKALTNINCEMRSMAVYSASLAMANQFKVDSNDSSFSTAIWESENQLIAAQL